LERAKIGEEPLSIFKIFHSFFDFFNKCKQKRSSAEEIHGNCYFFANSRWAIYLFSYWLTANIWAFPSGFPILFKNCPEAFQ
jgi:hypothetical protein